jgi:hypothetical protein
MQLRNLFIAESIEPNAAGAFNVAGAFPDRITFRGLPGDWRFVVVAVCELEPKEVGVRHTISVRVGPQGQPAIPRSETHLTRLPADYFVEGAPITAPIGIPVAVLVREVGPWTYEVYSGDHLLGSQTVGIHVDPEIGS